MKPFIAKRLPQRFSTLIEPAIKVGSDLKKPDLVIKDQDRLMVVDVTVRCGNTISHADAHTEKSGSTSGQRNTLNRSWTVRRRRFSPLTWAAEV